MICASLAAERVIKMKSVFNKIIKAFDVKLLKFIAVGILNTVVGTAIMFSLYNLAHLGYWFSSAANYIITSIMSFFLNKYFTFKSRGSVWKEALRFAANIAVCYILAYGIAKKATYILLSHIPISLYTGIMTNIFPSERKMTENIAMLVGMVLFVVFNYFGQRFFAFKNEE